MSVPGQPKETQVAKGVFGSVKVGSSSASPITMVFTLDAPVTLGSTAVLTQGAPNLDFTDAGDGTCQANTAYNAGDTCTVRLAFKPMAPGPRYGAAELIGTSGNLLATGYVQGTGVGPLVTFANSTSGVYLPGAQTNLGTGFHWPIGGAVDASGNVFVADTHSMAVKEIVAVNGTIPARPTIKVLGSGFIFPWSVAVDGAGNVFVGSDSDGAVKEIVAAGGYTTVKVLVSAHGPVELALDGSANIFVTECMSGGAIYELTAASGYSTKNILGKFAIPAGIAVDGNGNLFFAENQTHSIKEIVAAGGYTTVNTIMGGFPGASGVAVDAAGNIFVADDINNAIYEILAAGSYSTVITLSSSGFNPPGLAVDANGNVFVIDYSNNRVVKMSYANPPSLTFGAASVGVESSDSPQTVTVSNNGNADLTLPIPAAGRNPGISSGFMLDSATTCPDLGVSSAIGTLAAGTRCDYAVDFIPDSGSGSGPGSLILTDNTLNASPAVTQTIPLQGTVIGPHLAFSTPPPASLQVGHLPGTVAVSVDDSNDNVMTTSSATVTLTVTGPNSYSRVYTATASSGVASFSGLPSLSTIGSYSYTASGVPDGLIQAVAAESVWMPPPFGRIGAAVDSVTLNATVGQSDSVRVSGWVADSTDGAPLGNIQVFIDGNPTGAPTMNIPRPDVVQSYNNNAYLNSGYRVLFSASSLSIGTHQVTVVATNSGGQSATFGPRKFTVAATAGIGYPYGGIDEAGDSVTAITTISQSGTLKVSGWTVDSADGSPLTNVTVFIDGKSIGAPNLGLMRPDIVAAFGDNRYLHAGFRLLYPAASLAVGQHTITVVATDSAGRSTTFGPRTITVQ